MAKTKYNILYVYNETNRRLRATVEDLIWAFDRHSGHRCFYFNTIGPRLPKYLLAVDFDIIVFNALFLGQRNNPPSFARARETIIALRDLDCIKIAMPQDEYMHCDALCQFINEFGVTHVLSLGGPADWPMLYAGVDRSRIHIRQILAGYLEPSTAARIEHIVRQAPQRRPIDVGYRAWYAPPWLGRRALVKGKIADVFKDAARQADFVADIETDLDKVFAGDDWYRFLASCRFALGTEGGSGIADRDGSIRSRTQEYMRAHPSAGFDEIEAECFLGVDGKLDHFMITPRHLECCVTRTGQVLVEAGYNGILKPGLHYIAVKPDFSNIQDVVARMRDESARREMVERAYRDVVVGGRFEYGHHIRDIVALVEAGIRPRPRSAARAVWAALVRQCLRLHMAITLRFAWYGHLVLERTRRARLPSASMSVAPLRARMVNGIRRLLRG